MIVCCCKYIGHMSNRVGIANTADPTKRVILIYSLIIESRLYDIINQICFSADNGIRVGSIKITAVSPGWTPTVSYYKSSIHARIDIKIRSRIIIIPTHDYNGMI